MRLLDQLYHQLAHHLFPETTYHYNSGGDPKDIPDLTYEQLVEFYKTHYHPSNAVFMTFGNQTAYELQEQFENWLYISSLLVQLYIRNQKNA